MKWILLACFIYGWYVGYKELQKTGTGISDDGYRGGFWEMFRE